MARLFEVYDNEQVQLATRRQVAVTYLVLAAVVGDTFILFVLAREAFVPVWVAMALGGAAWAFAAHRLVVHMRRTNRVVWCVKISPEEVAGYDYARRKTSIAWSEVRQVELGASGLTIRAEGSEIEIPHLFPDFASLSHSIVAHAEQSDVSVLIEGRLLEDLDLHALFPFLSHPATPPPPGGGA